LLTVAALAGRCQAQIEVKPAQIEVQPVPIDPKQIQIQPLPGQPVPFGGPMALPGITLLQDKGVRKELKLSDAQVTKLEDLARQQKAMLKDLKGPESFKKLQEAMENAKKTVDETLTKDQAARLRQLTLQAQGAMAFLDPKVGEELKLTDEQRKAVGKAFAEVMPKVLGSLKDIKGLKPEETQKKIAEIQRGATEAVVKQ